MVARYSQTTRLPFLWNLGLLTAAPNGQGVELEMWKSHYSCSSKIWHSSFLEYSCKVPFVGIQTKVKQTLAQNFFGLIHADTFIWRQCGLLSFSQNKQQSPESEDRHHYLTFLRFSPPNKYLWILSSLKFDTTLSFVMPFILRGVTVFDTRAEGWEASTIHMHLESIYSIDLQFTNLGSKR